MLYTIGSVETYKDESGVLVLKLTSNAKLEKTATQMVSFHKGYDNVLEITIK